MKQVGIIGHEKLITTKEIATIGKGPGKGRAKVTRCTRDERDPTRQVKKLLNGGFVWIFFCHGFRFVMPAVESSCVSRGSQFLWTYGLFSRPSAIGVSRDCRHSSRPGFGFEIMDWPDCLKEDAFASLAEPVGEL